MQRAPSLGVFFWFFSLRQLEKEGWSSLSSQPRRKLLKPFHESYKFFKDRFFHVCPGYTPLKLKALRKKATFHSPAPVVTLVPTPFTKATTLSPMSTLPAQPIVEAHTPPTVVLNSPTNSLVEAASNPEPVAKK
ncbi:hypothetical protein CR513_42080, partial [Mucuna pruriens]